MIRDAANVRLGARAVVRLLRLVRLVWRPSCALQLGLISVLLGGRRLVKPSAHLLVHKCVGFPGRWGGADGRGTYSSSLSNFKQML